MKSFLFSCSFIAASFFAVGQDWSELMQKPDANLYQIQNKFEKYWSDKDKTEKGKGYKAFKRWENFVSPRVYPTGDISLLNLTAKNYQEWYNNYMGNNVGGKLISSSPQQLASTTWTAVGPMGPISGSAGGQLLKSGRMNFITVHPTNTLNLYVGAPAGGLWISTNGGTSWTTNTDNLAVTGCSDLAIDPINPNNMFLATGDGDAGDTRSIGVLKSTDGGNTWNATGLTFPVANGYLIRRLIINPTNPQIVIAATNGGIYRTINGGTNWTQVSTSNCYDLEFKPGDPNTVYAAGASFRLSTNGGASFTQITNGIPNTGVGRMAIAVTPADPLYVYVIAANNTDGGLLGFYRSTASGTVFTQQATSLNLLGWATMGNDAGGQGWYDLCIAASPLNKDEVVTGGVNVWRTLTGGGSWAIYGHWTGSGAPFTHADHHDLEFAPNGTLFNANDGTVYRRGTTSWTEISGTINISQIYKIGTSALTANKWITGHQDNGTSIWNGTTYNATMGGDGMDCFIDRTNDNNMFAEYYDGSFRKSTNGGGSWSNCTTGMTGTAPWVAIWKQDPVTPTTLYAGYTNLFKSTNSAGSWTVQGTVGGTGTIIEFAIAPSNNQVIYVLKSSGIYKTINGGTNWTNVTGTVPVASAAPQYIVIDPTDANNAWVVLSGYSAGNKVFMTANGGTSWTNYTSNLPNIPGNCLLYQTSTNDRIYVGMDVGVYYRDNLSATWTLYNTGLPNTPVSDMEISPANPTKIVAATYGRGTWIVDAIASSVPPSSSFNFTGTICSGTPKTFNDVSTNSPTSWSWSVTPSAGVSISSATVQNPSFTFSNGGTYTVTLVATNGAGPGSPSNQTVTVSATPTVVVTNSVQTICSGATATITSSGATTYSWNTGATTSSISVSPTAMTVYTITGTTGGCSNVKTATVNVNATPTVAVNNQTICSASSVTMAASGASTYSWNTGAATSSIVVSPALTTVYTVTGTAANGCKNVKTATITVNSSPTVAVTNSVQTICSGATATITASGATTYSWNTGATAANVTVSPTGTTVYTVTGTTGGCTNVKTATISVNASPTVNVNNASICSGGSATLTATGANSYSWNTGSASAALVVSPALTTVYTVTGTAVNGCKNIKTSTVTVNTTPSVSVSGSVQAICSGSSATITASGAATYSWNTGSTSANISVSPSGTTVYTVTGYNGTCASIIKTATITVNTSPTVSVNNATICSGATATITASGATTYSWNTGATAANISVSPTVTTFYTITGTSGACNNIKTATVMVNAAPSIGISANNTVICQGQMVSLTATGANTYTWQPGGVTGSVANFIPSASTIYTCTGTGGNGCNGNNSVSISVSPCTGIMNGSNEVSFNVYPNPVKDQITVNINTTKSFECKIEMYDAAGKLLLKQNSKFENGSNEQHFNMNTFAKGMYYMKITTKEGNVQTIKIVKE
ncbi:MAG: hypothetical protein K0S32_501 [Bacteroidetes bacterium]|jgi:hypothetical protein|nr:hypothetical protein [Bacteroidota bacterium]